MRLSDAQLKEGFLHPSPIVRDVVVRYFEESFTRDPEVTQYVMRGVEEYGWKKFLTWPHKVSGFPITDDASMEWLCRQLRQTDLNSTTENLHRHLESMLTNADIGLLVSHDVPHRMDELQLAEDRRGSILSRLKLKDSDPEDCWRALDDHCQLAGEEESFADAKISEATLLLEPLLRSGDQFVPRILEILQRPVVDPDKADADGWLIGMMIILAGQMRLEAAAPLMWKYWEVDWDWYDDEILYAMTQIGTPSVAQLVRERYPQSEWGVQLFSSGVLARFRCDGMSEVLEELLAKDPDDEFRGRFGIAAARQFDDHTAELARCLWSEDPDGEERDSIRECLIAFSYLSGWELPERDAWENEFLAKSDRRANSKPFAFLESMFARMPASASPPFPRIDEGDQQVPIRLPAPMSAPVVLSRRSVVGRNDPCPCGSGKKYKKCCLNGLAVTR